MATVKGVDYELVVTRPPKDVTPAFLKMNPNGLVPVLQDGDFIMFEGNAIMTYLADKNGWKDVYPTELKARAKVNEYLHWHHTHARLGTPQVLVPLIMEGAGKASPAQLEMVQNTEVTIAKSVDIMEKLFVKPYIAQSTQPTVADYACYCEMDQLEIMDVFDFTKYPKTSNWMKRMKDVPFHDEIRATLNEFLTKMNLNPAPKK
ncbi:hypothetical protein BBJ28_00018058 [Nothophytophthora sp. Chile5]|nr:hypothetical protein BBJ28_00018058 [Nothophytophthora sp. Chile5]